MPCRICGRVWRKRRRFAFWRNRPTWRRRRALAIGRAHSLYSHPGWLETAHQTAHMCFSVINSTMTPSRRRAQDCPRPLVLPHGCVCPPAFHERAPGAGCGSSAQTDRGHDRLPSACPCCACRLMHGRESGSVRWPAAAAFVSVTAEPPPPVQSLWHLQMRHPRRRERSSWPAVALWGSCDPWAAARGPGGAQPSSLRGTDTRQRNAHACGGEHMSGGGSLTHPSTPARTARVADEPTQPIFDDEPSEDIAPRHTPGFTARHCARANVFFSRTPQRAHASLFELWGCA